MIAVTVLVQQDQVQDDNQRDLIRDLERFAQRHFSDAASVNWMEVPTGSGFTAAKPSTSVVVSLQSNRALEQSEREPLIRELCELCMQHTHRTPHEVVAAIRDPMPVGED